MWRSGPPAEAAERNRRLLDAIPEATRAEGLAHAEQPPTIEGQVLAAELTDHVEKRAAAEAAEAADREAAHAARAASSAFELAAMNARDYETRDVAADLVASQPARVPWDPVEAELDRRYATDDHRYTERLDIGHGVKLDLGGRRMDLELQILEHAKSGRSRVPPARQATLGATITAVVESIQKGADQLVNRILDKVLGRVRDPAPTAATLPAAAPTAAPADEPPAPPASPQLDPHPDPSLDIRDEPAAQSTVYGAELHPDRGAGELAGGRTAADEGPVVAHGEAVGGGSRAGFAPTTTRGISYAMTGPQACPFVLTNGRRSYHRASVGHARKRQGSVTAIPPRQVDSFQNLDSGIERFTHAREALAGLRFDQGLGQPVAPSAVLLLQALELGYGRFPPRRTGFRARPRQLHLGWQPLPAALPISALTLGVREAHGPLYP